MSCDYLPAAYLEYRGDTAYAERLRKIALLVNVHFVELDFGMFLAQLVDHGRKHSAGSAPVRPKIDDAYAVFRFFIKIFDCQYLYHNTESIPHYFYFIKHFLYSRATEHVSHRSLYRRQAKQAENTTKKAHPRRARAPKNFFGGAGSAPLAEHTTLTHRACAEKKSQTE